MDRWLCFLILVEETCEKISVNFIQGEYFVDDFDDDFGENWILATSSSDDHIVLA